MSRSAENPVMPRHSLRGEVAHVFRPSLFRKEERFVVHGTEVQWSDKNGEHSVPIASIRRVHIYEAPGSAGRTIHRAILRLEDGRKLIVHSNHFVRIGTFEDRLETYRAFLITLLERLEGVNPSAQVLVGTPRGLWVTYLILLVTSAVVLAGGAILSIIGDFPASAAATFALLIGFWPLCWRVVRGGAAHEVGAAGARQSLPD